MKSQLTKLAAAVAFACAASPSFAAIGTGDSASLFLEVFDTGTSGKTYIRDLGVSMLDFGTQNRATGGFTNIADNNNADDRTWNLNFNNAGVLSDGNWSTFISGISSTSNLIWHVVASDANGSTAADQKRAIYTSSTDQVAKIALSGIQQTNAGINAMSAIDTHIGAANTLLAGGESGISPSTGDAATFFSANMNNNLGSGLNGLMGNTTALLGSTMGFYYLTRTGSSNTAEAVAAKYASVDGAATWTLDSAGSLVYDVPVAAVPEPGTWAMFVGGLLMVGGMARRRMS